MLYTIKLIYEANLSYVLLCWSLMQSITPCTAMQTMMQAVMLSTTALLCQLRSVMLVYCDAQLCWSMTSIFCDTQLCWPMMTVYCDALLCWSMRPIYCDAQLCWSMILVYCDAQLCWSMMPIYCDAQLRWSMMPIYCDAQLCWSLMPICCDAQLFIRIYDDSLCLVTLPLNSPQPQRDPAVTCAYVWGSNSDTSRQPLPFPECRPGHRPAEWCVGQGTPVHPLALAMQTFTAGCTQELEVKILFAPLTNARLSKFSCHYQWCKPVICYI